MEGAQHEAEFFAGVWERLTVPIRPSSEGLELYRREIGGLSDESILVLGATPELIDMALDSDAGTVVSVERFPAVAEAMRSLGTRDWASVQMVLGDWLEDRPGFHSRFTYIACDGGLLFLRYPDEWQRLFGLARRYLKPGGVFVAKSWAEPEGQRDYDSLAAELIASFEAQQAGQSLERTRTAYRRLASELRVAALVDATNDDGLFDQQILVDRADRLIADMEAKFPDSESVAVSHAALKHLARSLPGSTDTVTGVGFDGAAPLLQGQGFTDCEHLLLQDPPVPGGNYMLIAR